MEKNVYVATVGLTKQPVIDGLRIKPFDYIYLITNDTHNKDSVNNYSKENPKNIAYSIKDFVDEFFSSTQKCEIFLVNLMDFNESLDKIISIYKNHRKDNITVNITGGTKIMVSAALIGAYVIGAEILYVKEAKEKDVTLEERIIWLPTPKIPIEELGESHRKLLLILDKQPNKELKRATTYLSQELRLKKPTISAHINFLRENKLIEYKRSGRDVIIKLTASGELLAKFYHQ